MGVAMVTDALSDGESNTWRDAAGAIPTGKFCLASSRDGEADV